MKVVLAAALLIAGCSKSADRAPDTPGARLEAAAVTAGLVADPGGSIGGSWARGTDRLCIMGSGLTETTVGALVDYGDGQSCAARGVLRRSGERLDLQFGDCRVRARFDGERIVFPPELPSGCDSACDGRASLAALTVDRVSGSLSEAATLKDPNGKPLCGT